jgi:hypothetical protein
MNLDQEVRESILHYLDREGLFTKRKKREQFVKRSLAELDQGIRDGIAYHLGREHLAELREVRFANFPEDLRDMVWQHYRETGQFLDSEKEEYLEIAELKDLSPDLRRGLVAALKQDIEELLSERSVGELPQEIQTDVLDYLEQEEYFVDRDRLAQFRAASASDLDPELYNLVCLCLGQRMLPGMEQQRVSALPEGLRRDVESYLEGSEYFLDEAKKEKFMQRGLANLDDAVREGLIQSLGLELVRESMGRPIAEFKGNDREYLRDYLDSVGHFLDQDALAQFEQGMLTDQNLDTRDYEGLASRLGQDWLRANGDRKFDELEKELQEEIERHLRSSDYFLDDEKLQRFREQGISHLDEERRRGLLRYLSQRRAEEMRAKSLSELDEGARHDVERFLAEQGFGLDDAGMAEFLGRRLSDLDEELRAGLAAYLGHRWLSRLGDQRIADLDEESRTEVQRYLGRQLVHEIEKRLMLGYTSRLWVDYLTAIEDLRQGIGLQAYGQMDPLVEYKRRAFRMFGELNDNINRMVTGNVFRYPPQPFQLMQSGQG